MHIFEYKKIGNKIKLNIFGIKVTFCLPPKRNYYISLGYNCLVRTILTNFALKASKKQGELSCPFDLCVTPLNSIIEILENDFTDFFEDIEECPPGEWEHFINKKYSIQYPHESNLTLREFKKRYMRRIENFRKISETNSLKKYVLYCEQNNFTVEQLNKIYDILKIYCKGSPFKFYIVHLFHDITPKVNLRNLNPAIIFNEYDISGEIDVGWNERVINKNILTDIMK